MTEFLARQNSSSSDNSPTLTPAPPPSKPPFGSADMVLPQGAVLAPAMAPAPAAEKINFRGRSFKVAEVSDGPMPVTTPLQPQAPPRESLYSDRVGRARAANRTSVLARSQSQAELEERKTAAAERALAAEDDSSPAGLRSGDAAAPSHGMQLPAFGSGRRPSVPSADLAARMAAEVERADCAVMVRDVTMATLPTRAVPPGAGCANSFALDAGPFAVDRVGRVGFSTSAAAAAEVADAHSAGLTAAIASSDTDAVAALLTARADPNTRLASGKTALGAAAEGGMQRAVSTLLAHGASANAADAYGDTPLHRAAAAGHPILVSLLLASGAAPAARNAGGEMAVALAADDRVRKLLLGDPDGSSPINGDGDDGDDDDDEGEEGAEGAAVAQAEVSPSRISGTSDAGEVEETPPSKPPPRGDASTASLPADELLGELRRLLRSSHADPKRMLIEPVGLGHEVQCDVVRLGRGDVAYRCYLRLPGVRRRVCVLEASRSRKGKLNNAHYHIRLPPDPRLAPVAGADDGAASEKGYCGKIRAFNLSGANFVCYDDGAKPGQHHGGAGGRVRRQMLAVTFNKANSRRAPMTMRVLAPSPATLAPGATPAHGHDLLDTLQGMSGAAGPVGHEAPVSPPPEGTELLRLVPPKWNEEGGMYQLSYEGRACCMSNKNVQLANVADDGVATLQVGKLRKDMFNMDLRGVLSPFQAFAIALAIFDQSSVRRRF